MRESTRRKDSRSNCSSTDGSSEFLPLFALANGNGPATLARSRATSSTAYEGRDSGAMASIGHRKRPPDIVGRNEACEADGRDVSTGAPYFLRQVNEHSVRDHSQSGSAVCGGRL